MRPLLAYPRDWPLLHFLILVCLLAAATALLTYAVVATALDGTDLSPRRLVLRPISARKLEAEAFEAAIFATIVGYVALVVFLVCRSPIALAALCCSAACLFVVDALSQWSYAEVTAARFFGTPLYVASVAGTFARPSRFALLPLALAAGAVTGGWQAQEQWSRALGPRLAEQARIAASGRPFCLLVGRTAVAEPERLTAFEIFIPLSEFRFRFHALLVSEGGRLHNWSFRSGRFEPLPTAVVARLEHVIPAEAASCVPHESGADDHRSLGR
ncbi:MAG: hypothetical protein K2X11_17590 [Acetobacteraceae bacterium]|nr:hypothetical protein [Acetobacteraceae bacterium]